MCCSAASFWNTPFRSASKAHLQSVASKPGWDLNLGYSCRKSCNVFVVSGLTAGFCLDARFRCFYFPPYLNQKRCLLKPRNIKFFNVLRWISCISFRFRCPGHSATRLVDTPARSTSGAHLRSVAFHTRLGSEPWARLLKVLQCVCCEWVGGLI